MSYNILKLILIYKFIAVLLILLSGCIGAHRTGYSAKIVTPSLLSRTVDSTRLSQLRNVYIAPLIVQDRSGAPLEGDLPFYRELLSAAKEELRFGIIDRSQLPKKIAADTDSIIAAAKKAGADGVLLTTLSSFHERVGSAIGVESAARVDFEMILRNVNTGTDIWVADFHYQDEALSENLFRIGEHFKKGSLPHWRTGQELIQDGFHKAFTELTSAQDREFKAN